VHSAPRWDVVSGLATMHCIGADLLYTRQLKIQRISYCRRHTDEITCRRLLTGGRIIFTACTGYSVSYLQSVVWRSGWRRVQCLLAEQYTGRYRYVTSCRSRWWQVSRDRGLYPAHDRHVSTVHLTEWPDPQRHTWAPLTRRVWRQARQE